MAYFSQKSLDILATCDKRLQVIMREVIEQIDCAIICGHRTEEEQNQAYQEKKSKLKWPNSKHNTNPSKAVDVVPYPIDWNDVKRFFFMAGVIKAVAHMKCIDIRWGGDWNSNGLFSDEKFSDLPHFELVE